MGARRDQGSLSQRMWLVRHWMKKRWCWPFVWQSCPLEKSVNVRSLTIIQLRHLYTLPHRQVLLTDFSYTFIRKRMYKQLNHILCSVHGHKHIVTRHRWHRFQSIWERTGSQSLSYYPVPLIYDFILVSIHSLQGAFEAKVSKHTPAINTFENWSPLKCFHLWTQTEQRAVCSPGSIWCVQGDNVVAARICMGMAVNDDQWLHT